MKVAVIAATGKAGSLIAREAAARGHEVTAVIRPGTASRLEGKYAVLEKDIFELTTQDVAGFDAVVDAFGTPFGKPGSEYQHQTSMEALIRIFTPLPKVRLLVVGGASSLYTDRSREHKILEEVPQEFRAVPENMLRAFENLKTSGINWTYFSPAKTFDAGGARTGKYRLGTDYAIANASGESYISYADYAVALVDELENGAFVGKRFTAVSDAPYYQDEKRLFSIGGTPFTRRGSYFGIYSEPGYGDGYGQSKVYLGTRRGAAANNPTNRMFSLAPTYRGHKVPYAVKTSASELTLQTRYGGVSFAFAEPSLLLIRGEKGLGLRLETRMTAHEMVKRRGDDAWEAIIRWVCSLVLKPLRGELAMDAPWEWEELSTPRVKADMLPDDTGAFTLAIEEFTHAGWVRDAYPAYEEGKASAAREFAAFLQNIPHLPGPLEERREEAAWFLWSYFVNPSGKIKRPLIYMTGTSCASEWQMCQNAVALHRDLALSVELLLNMFDEASPVGQLPDFYDDMRGIYQLIKPPLQGWALKLLMKDHDLGREVPREKLEALYAGCAKWADWFMRYRDDDHDGLPQYEHGDETGLDDCSVFKVSPVMETPDLCALLGLLFEALGDLAKILGKDPSEASEWYRRSKEIIDRMLAAFWNGERFVALVSGTHEVVATDSILYYLPIILGRRLPQQVIDRLAHDLSVEGDLLTPYGLASEKISTSDDFALGRSMAKGSILPSNHMLIVPGLMDAGKEDLARLIAKRYCTAMKDGGLSLLVNPFSGARGAFGCSWPACAYIALAQLCG